MQPKKVLRIVSYILSFLISYALLVFLFSRLPTPLNIVFMTMSFLFFGFIAIYVMDMTLPFFNLINRVPVRIPSQFKQAVTLTFDDGPSSPYTTEILDILDRYNVKAAFFCIGENIMKHPQIVLDIYKRGHSIGNHSFRHVLFPFLQTKRMKDEITETSRMIQNITGKKEKWFRFPKGYQSRKGFNMAKSMDLKPIGFSYPIYDVENPPAQELVDRTLRKVKGGDILLMHDGFPSYKPGSRSSLVEALPAIIEGVQKKGLTFVRLEDVF